MVVLNSGSCSDSSARMILPIAIFQKFARNLRSFDAFAISSFHCLYQLIPFCNCLLSFQWNEMYCHSFDRLTYFSQVENMNKGQDRRKHGLFFWLSSLDWLKGRKQSWKFRFKVMSERVWNHLIKSLYLIQNVMGTFVGCWAESWHEKSF